LKRFVNRAGLETVTARPIQPAVYFKPQRNEWSLQMQKILNGALLSSFIGLAGVANAQYAPGPPAPPPQFFVYEGKALKLTLDEAVKQINALSPIAYIDTQMTNDYTAKPVHDVEKIAVTPAGGHIEFWSDDSLDGMAMESSFDVQWRQVDGHGVYIINNPENGQDYQVEVLTPGNFVIANAFRNIGDNGHLAPLQQGDPDNMFTFDNAGDLPKAEHVADLLATLITLSNAMPLPAPVPQLDETADVTTADDSAGATGRADITAGAPIATADPEAPVISAPAGPPPEAATVPVPAPPGAVVAPGVTLTEVAPPKPAPYMHPATSYFEGNFAVRVTPRQDGTAGVDVINISSQTHRVAVSVTGCQNIAGGDCGNKFKGPLAPGMKLSFPIAGDDATHPWDFHVDAAQNGA
jgi:hypothetical protein